MRGLWSMTSKPCTTGQAWCATGVMIARPQCLTPSTATAGRTVANPERMIPPSQLCLSNLWEKHNCLSGNPNKEVKVEWSTQAVLLGITLPTIMALGKDQWRKHLPPTHTTHHILFHKT